MLALAPYMYWNINHSFKDDGKNNRYTSVSDVPVARLIDVFNGHTKYGERVLEYMVKMLPSLLGIKLADHNARSLKNNDAIETD